jgi:hypothetical protein
MISWQLLVLWLMAETMRAPHRRMTFEAGHRFGRNLREIG